METTTPTKFRWIPNVVVPVLCAVGGIILTILWQWYTERVQKLEYNVVSSGSLNNMIGMPNELQINTVPLHDAGLLTVNVYNTTNQDFDSLTVEMMISDTTVKVVSVDYKGLEGKLARIRFKKDEERGTYLFTVGPVNRTDEPFLRVNFITDNISTASCVVDVRKVGVETKRTELITELQQAKGNTHRWMFMAGATLVCMTVMMLGWTRETRRLEKLQGEIDVLYEKLSTSEYRRVEDRRKRMQARLALQEALTKKDEPPPGPPRF